MSEQERVTVDHDACTRVAAVLSRAGIPLDAEDEFPDLGLDEQALGNYYLATVAICHQTQSLVGRIDGEIWRGWDYLARRLALECRRDPALLTPKRWRDIHPSALNQWFTGTQVLGPLSRIDERAALLNDLGRSMEDHNWNTLRDLYNACGGRSSSGEPNIMGLLSGFRAYRDPVQKKSVFLLGLMANTGGWRYIDDDALPPPVDYHEVRGHFRIGTVVIADPELNRRLLAREIVSEQDDIQIRAAVRDAIRAIARAAGSATAMQLHYLFWNVFRNACLRESPYCYRCPDALRLPDRYRHLLVQRAGYLGCPFVNVCRSAGAARYAEHVFDTDWY